MSLDPQQSKIIKELSIKHDLTEKEIIEIINSPFKFIRKEIKEIEMTTDETEESFNKKIKNFNIPYIGKLYGSIYNYKHVNNARRRKENESKVK